jgi:hypothetical protein
MTDTSSKKSDSKNSEAKLEEKKSPRLRTGLRAGHSIVSPRDA